MTDEEILAIAEATGLKLITLGLDKQKSEFFILAFAKQIAKLERYHEREAIERHEANVQKFLGAPQPEQEPVGEVVNATDKAFECKFVKILPIGTKFYTIPPQRTWVGLTDEEVRKICVNEWGGYEQCRAIEAKLKEKNT